MDVSQFLNNVENDDTLQNIRKEYLNSKRTLQELMTNQSPTKKMEFSKKPTLLQERNSNDYINRNVNSSKPTDDEFLRRQLREGLSRKPEPKISLPSLASDTNRLDSIYSSVNKIDELEKKLYHHELQIQALKNELYQSNASNRALQNEVAELQDSVRMLAALSHSNVKADTDNSQLSANGKWTRHYAGPNSNGNGVYLDRPQSAPSTSSTSEWVANALHDSDDTRVLLGWKQPSSTRVDNSSNFHFPHNQPRNLSNFDDNTSRLIGVTGKTRN